jgi:metal-sulfur cluster biosynthetic enzyme
MLNENTVREALRAVYDPELGLDIVTLGMVYGITVSEEGAVDIRMTLTTPGCPMERVIMDGIQHAVSKLDGVTKIGVDLVWEPRWSPEKIDPEGQKILGLGR